MFSSHHLNEYTKSMSQSNVINCFCYDLPAAVAQPLHREYEGKWAEIERILATPGNNYQELMGYESTVQSLLALSLFYRYVYGHIETASGFYVAINKGQKRERSIKIGTSVFNKDEQNKIIGAIITFESICFRFQIQPAFFCFSETIQFVRKCRDLFLTPEYEEDDTV